jgi:hypothetical protein
MYFHYQNLNDEHPKRYWLHGRCWLGHDFLHAEWHFPAWWSWEIQVSLNHYGDTAVGFHIGLGLVWLHLSTSNRWLYRFLEPITKRKDQKYTNGRTIGFRFYAQSLWVDLWNDPMEHRRKDPRWWSFKIDFADLLFGKSKYASEVLQSGQADIHMPEGVYGSDFKVERCVWKRPRWFAKTLTDVWFDIPIGIPSEGKGENSWDQDMDATFGIGTHWDGNVHQAAKRVALRCLERRSKYGSLSSPAYAEWRQERMKRMGPG